MEGGPRRWARAGAREEILDAGEGLFATKRFQKGEEILDYRYIGGKEVRGDEVEWLTQEQFRRRYPPREGMPEGGGTHVLRSRGKKPIYYDTARTGGVGGKANTKKGECTAEFDPDMRMIATEVIEAGEEIFVEYGTGYSWEEATEEREGWEYVRSKRGREERKRSVGGLR